MAQLREAFTEGFNQNCFPIIGPQFYALCFFKFRPPVAIWHEFVKPGNHDRVLDACRPVYKVEHKIEDHFRVLPSEHLLKRLQRDAPSFRINQKERKSILWYRLEYVG